MVTRDADQLADMASADLAAVYVSLPTVNDDLSGVLEPRTSRPPRRLRAIELLSARGIPVAALIALFIPGLTNHENYLPYWSRRQPRGPLTPGSSFYAFPSPWRLYSKLG